MASKNIIAVAGVISAVVGIVLSIPAFLKNQYGVAIGGVFLLVLGLVLVAVAFE